MTDRSRHRSRTGVVRRMHHRRRAKQEGTRLQQEQRKLYREKLLQAAQQVFSRKTYSGSSIDDIVLAADVSRATFYRYFASKIEITSALTDRLVAALHSAYEGLCDATSLDEMTLTAWVKANVALCRQMAPLVHTIREAAAIEPAFFREHTTASHEQAIRMLGQRIRAFQIASGAAAGSAVRVRAHLLMRQLDMFCYDVAVSQWTEGLEVGSRVLAQQFMTFIDEFAREA